MNSNVYKIDFKKDSKKNTKMQEWFECIPARLVLYLLALNGITVTFIMRIAIYLTILAMVKETPMDKSSNNTNSFCFTNYSTNMTLIDYGGTLDWSLDDQFYILTSFYWTYIISQVVGGVFAQKFGTKIVFGWSLLISSICNLFVPFFSYIHYVIVVILQIIHGFAQGLTWPTLYAVIGVWIPIQERSRFVSCFQGLSLGVMLANLLSGFIIAKFGWVYVFYCTGALGLLSTLMWYLLMHDNPEQHPRISKEELQYIQTNREQHLHSEKVIPWVSILTSIPVWGIAISSFGRLWISSTLFMYGPLYLKTILGLTVEKNGLVLGVSSFVGFLSTLLFSYLSDKIVTYKLMTLVNNRKLFSAIGHIIPGIMALTIDYLKCNIPLTITVWILIQSFLSASFSGAMSNIVDISPSCTGPVSSIIQVILVLPTIFAPLVVKILLENEATLEAWRKVFYISSGIVISTYTFFALFASGKVQSWDLAKSSSTDMAKNELLDDKNVELHVANT